MTETATTYALLLNDMRSPHVENLDIVRVADSPEELAEWYSGQLTERWADGQWGKSFRQGSDLEWYNPVADISVHDDYWGGIWPVADGTVPMRGAVTKC